MSAMGEFKHPGEVSTPGGTVSDSNRSASTESKLDMEGTFADYGVDLTLIRWMLRRTPIERLQAAQQLIDATWALRNDSEA